ncbi:MAG: HPP family protein [Acidimicrobiales bacterium]
MPERAASTNPSSTEGRNPPPGSLTGRAQRAFGTFGIGMIGVLGCGPTVAAAGVLAWVTGQPWVFPSLGPTILLAYETPLRAQASPRHTIIGHAVGVGVGYLCLAAFGLRDTPAATVSGFTPTRIGAVAVAVAATTFALYALRCEHPPAGASALIVALGILRTPTQLGVMVAPVVMVTALSWTFNRLTGIPVPLWSPKPSPSRAD